MKKLLLVSMIVVVSMQVQAQFTKATLQATGLTCAMCSNAINKALERVPSIATVQSDIKNSAFNIVFKTGAEVSIDELKDAVEDAGFSVGNLNLTGDLSGIEIKKDHHVKIGDEYFHFLNDKDQSLHGLTTITVLDKDFVTSKQFKKISATATMECVKTGKAAACCEKDGLEAGTRIYHVKI